MTVPAPRGRGTTAPAGPVVVLTRQAVTDIATIAIALVTLGLLLRFKISEPSIVAAAGALGPLLHWPLPPDGMPRKEHRH